MARPFDDDQAMTVLLQEHGGPALGRPRVVGKAMIEPAKALGMLRQAGEQCPFGMSGAAVRRLAIRGENKKVEDSTLARKGRGVGHSQLRPYPPGVGDHGTISAPVRRHRYRRQHPEFAAVRLVG